MIKRLFIFFKYGIIVGILLIAAILVIFLKWRHNDNDNCGYDTYELCKNFEGNPFPGDLNVIEIRFCESKLERDTVRLNFVLPEFEFENHVCSFLFPDDYKVLKIERSTEYCATIVRSENDTLTQSQFLKLSDLKRIQSKSIELINKNSLKNSIFNSKNTKIKSQYRRNNELFDRVLHSNCLFYYTKSVLRNDTKGFYNSISKNRLRESTTKEVRRICEVDREWNFEQEKKNWLVYVQNYKVGDFFEQDRIFCVDKFSETLKITFQKEDEVLTKYFVFDIQVGN
jgi:hypothetical protein